MMSIMKDISLRTPEQLGAAIRLKRKEKGLSQNRLAELLDVDRKWVIRLEAGNPGAELGRVLKLLDALDLRASLKAEDRARPGKSHSTSPSRLDEVFRRLEQRSRR
jgi:HTH-type transcriptional regulator / antitoxin HipB